MRGPKYPIELAEQDRIALRMLEQDTFLGSAVIHKRIEKIELCGSAAKTPYRLEVRMANP